MTIVGLHDFVKISISAEFKSFLLIMCIDAPESTTNSRFSRLRFDGASKHLFFRKREECWFISPLIIRCFQPTSTLLRGHIALTIPFPPETDTQIWERWRGGDEDHLGKSFQTMDFGLECQRDLRRLLWTLHASDWFFFCLSCSAKSMKTSAAPCPEIRHSIVVYFFSIATALLSPFFWDLLLSNSSTWRCAWEHFSPNLHQFSDLQNKHTTRCHFS